MCSASTDRSAVISQLEARVLELEAESKRVHAQIAYIEGGTGDPAPGAPYHNAEMSRLTLARSEAELTWARDLIERLRTGDLDPWGSPTPPSS